MGNEISFQEKALVQSIVRELLPDARVMLFGSRVTGDYIPASDLDVAIDAGEPIPLRTQSKLQLAFSESSLPYFVDIVDWHAISDEFRQVVREQLITI